MSKPNCAIRLSLLVFITAALMTSPVRAEGFTECSATRASALNDPDFDPAPVKLVSTINCRELEIVSTDPRPIAEVRGIYVQTTAGDGSIDITNIIPIKTPGGGFPSHPAAIFAIASPQFLEWKEFPRYGIDPVTHESGPLPPVNLLVWSSGPSPLPTDYHSGPIKIANDGAITITGLGAAISARGSVDAVTIENSGPIDATGSGTAAIWAITGVNNQLGIDGVGGFRVWDWELPRVDYPGGAISITNSGGITMRGNTVYALRGDSLGGGVTLSNSGELKLIGDQATALFAEGYRGTLSLANTGAITLQGAAGQGLSAELFVSGAIDIKNDNTIKITGEEATGIRARSGEGDPTGAEASSNVTRITGSGAISVNGDYATGIDLSQRWGTGIVDYAGKVTATGDHATGITAETEFGTVTVKAGGAVTATGIGSIGIAVVGATDPITDPKNSDGYLVTNSGALNVEVAKGATVQGGSTATNPASAMDLGAGVLIFGGTDNTVTNHGTISAASGIAVLAYEGMMPDGIADRPVRIEAGKLALLNDGLISGNVFTGSGNDTITNSGSSFIIGNISTGAGNDTVTNTGKGVITGNIDLGDGVNKLLNEENAIINSLETINVGTGTPFAHDPKSVSTFTNAGILSPGGLGTTQKTTITGDFVQTSTGRLLIDINPNAKITSDMIEVVGRATLAGSVVPNIVDFSKPLASRYLIMQADSITRDGIRVSPSSIAINSTVGFNFSLHKEFAITAIDGQTGAVLGTADRLYLDVERRGTVADQIAASPVQTGAHRDGLVSLGRTLDQLEQSGGAQIQPLLTALGLQSSSTDLANAMSRLMPQSSTRQTANAVGSHISVGNAMLSCASRDGEFAYTKEDSCYYAKFTARRTDRDVTSDGAGSRETGTEFLGGVQVPIWQQIRLGMALGFEDFNAKSFDAAQQLSTSDGHRYSTGLVLKNQWGPFNAYLNLTGGLTQYDHRRYVNLAGVGGTASGEQNVWSGVTRLRLSYLNNFGPWYFKPLVDVAASFTRLGGYTETGAGAANLQLFASDKWLYSVMPGAEIGGQLRLAGGTLLRPYIRAGIIVFNDNSSSITTTFADAPAGVTPFVVTGKFDQIAADVETGMHVLTTSGINMRLDYEGRYGETSRQHAGTVKVSVPLGGLRTPE